MRLIRDKGISLTFNPYPIYHVWDEAMQQTFCKLALFPKHEFVRATEDYSWREVCEHCLNSVLRS